DAAQRARSLGRRAAAARARRRRARGAPALGPVWTAPARAGGASVATAEPHARGVAPAGRAPDHDGPRSPAAALPRGVPAPAVLLPSLRPRRAPPLAHGHRH